MKTSQSNTVDRTGSAFSLFRRRVYFTFQSPLLLPTRSSFSRARLWRRRSNTGNQKPAALLIFCHRLDWAKLGTAPVLTPSQTQTGVCVGGSCTFICSLLIVKASSFLMICALWFVFASSSYSSCQGCVLIFMDAHSVTSPCLFMHVGKITQGYLGSTVLINLLPRFCKCYHCVDRL